MARRPAYIPDYGMRHRDGGITVWVRPARGVPGYSVDRPGWAVGPVAVSGRRAAIRAAQHRAAPRPPHRTPAARPGLPARGDFAPGAPLLGLTPGCAGWENTGIRYRNGTYTVDVPGRYDLRMDELLTWTTYVYRSRRAAIRGWQHAAHGSPVGWAGALPSHTEDDRY